MFQNTVLRRVQDDSKVAIAVASSGIAAILLQGGRTAHSRFKIPLNATAQSSCAVSKKSDLADLLVATKLIFWDEISMQNCYNIEAVDCMLQDIWNTLGTPFGGIFTCFCGDFCQILPVIKGAESGYLARATLRTSYFWNHIKILRLTKNMRLQNPNLTDQGQVNMEAFAQSLLHVGNGTAASTGGSHAVDWSTGWLSDDSTNALINTIYSDLSHHSPKFFTSRAILCTLNKNVAYFNRQVLQKFPGEAIVCTSRDQVVNQEDSFLLPTKTMNAFEPASLPPHHLELKVDCVIMLLRNLEPSKSLCNGTRLQVKHIGSKTLNCRVLGVEHDGWRHFIPRIPLAPPDSNDLHAPFRQIQYC